MFFIAIFFNSNSFYTIKISFKNLTLNSGNYLVKSFVKKIKVKTHR